MSSAAYGEDLSSDGYRWNKIQYTLESGAGTGDDSGGGYGSTAFSTGYNNDDGPDRYAPGRSYDTLTGYGFLDISISYRGGYQPSYRANWS